MIEERISRKYLAMAKEIKQSHVLLDSHAHPFELFYGAAEYRKDHGTEGLYSAGGPFALPMIRDIATQDDERTSRINRLFLRSGIAPVTLGRLYRNTGPAVFRRHMDLSGIDKVLLLPVARPQDDIDRQMIQMRAMFGGDEDFILGWCVPASVPDDGILPAAESAVRRFGIKAVKLHLNIMQINPRSAQGLRRIESIIQSCNLLKLPLIVHGGKSPQLGGAESSCYGIAKNLKEIDWSITNSPVVICHAATYGCDVSEINKAVYDVGLLLSQNRNMLVDISALEANTLALVLGKLDCERIIFGSDMLYESQWATVVKLLLVLENANRHPEDIFLQITSINPQKYIFGPRPYVGSSRGRSIRRARERRSCVSLQNA